MKKYIPALIFLLIGGILLYQFAKFYQANLASIPTAMLPPARNIADIQNTTDVPLKLPDGFSISIYVKGLGSPRVLAFDPGGVLFASIPSEGKVVAFGKITTVVLDHLNKPHGLAFRCGSSDNICQLFVAEENKISRYDYFPKELKASNGQKILDLPAGGNHVTRTIGFGSDGRLYVSIGSSCNVCVEKDNRRAAIVSMNPDGTGVKTFATGLRNSVFFTWNPFTSTMWATEMGRDLLGDDIPPDEINIIEDGKNYGWPNCYGKQIHDSNYDQDRTFKEFCQTGSTPSHIDLPAHSAPLGLAFIPKESNWPKEYWGDLLVSYHGSWNRSTPTGYKIVRIKLDKDENAAAIEDFISGWLEGNESLGRPVDLLFSSDGSLYISDDKAGVIYKVIYRKL